MPPYRTFLGAWRNALARTQILMAEELGVKLGRYKAWEYGHVTPRDPVTRARLEAAFGLPLAILLGPAVVKDDGVTVASLIDADIERVAPRG